MSIFGILHFQKKNSNNHICDLSHHFTLSRGKNIWWLFYTCLCGRVWRIYSKFHLNLIKIEGVTVIFVILYTTYVVGLIWFMFCHIFSWHIFLFHGTKPIFGVKPLHTLGKLWAKLCQMCQPFSGKKWLFLEIMAHFNPKNMFFGVGLDLRWCPNEWNTISFWEIGSIIHSFL